MNSSHNRVFVAHPGLQHSHQLALALYEIGALQLFWSGVPLVSDDDRSFRWLPEAVTSRVRKVGIPSELRRHPFIFPLALKLGSRLPMWKLDPDLMHRLCYIFDWWVSKQINSVRPTAVVAYENSALHTFRAAKKVGARCVLDAASVHFSTGRRLNQDLHLTDGQVAIDERKKREIDLADLILTCSPLAAESYVQAGIPSENVRSVLLGTHATISKPVRTRAQNEPLRLIFAGALSHRKAIDIILDATSRFDPQLVQVLFVGGAASKSWLDAINGTRNATYHPSVSQNELQKFFLESDCLLLPSRFDSFGMVVVEAMACGLPAIVSTNTGAKEIINKFPHSGWIIECTADQLANCIQDLIDKPEKVLEASVVAYAAAQSFSWQAYRTRIGQVFQELVCF